MEDIIRFSLVLSENPDHDRSIPSTGIFVEAPRRLNHGYY